MIMLSTLPVAALLLVLLRAVLAQAPGNLRLRGGNHVNEGRLEIFLNGQWGTICDDGWSIQDARVACRQLGFPGALKSVPGAFYGVGDGEIWLDEMRCRGDELSLLACNTDMIGGHDCSHDKDAGVVCLMPDMIQLVDGDAPNAGRLEIYHDNSWGSVCRDEFDNIDGTVACQQLGYSRLKEHYWGNQTIPGTGMIWLDDINCSSSHVRLSQCQSRGWNVNDCRHSDDINLVCEGIPMEPDRPIVTETKCSNVVLQWRRPAVDNGRDIHRYYIKYKPVDQSEWSYIIHDNFSSSDRHLSTTIPNLAPATSYEVAIAANNMVGNSSYSRPVTMTTREIVFDPPVNVGVADGGSGILHVSWNYSVNEDCGVSANVHIVEYNDSINSYHLLVENTTSCTLTGLTVNIHYNISVRVGIATKYGYVLSHSSESIIAVSMPTTAPVIAPKLLSTWTINASAILLSWQCTDEVKIGYIIFCHKHDDPNNYWVQNVTAGCTHLEQGIMTNIVYTCKVASFNDIGNGPFSDHVHTVRQYEALNPIPNTSVLAVTMDSIILAIEQGSHDVPDGYVLTETIGYDVTCRSSSVLSHVAEWGSVVSVTVDKLSPDQEYSCDIVAINKFGVGNTTNVIVTTSSSAPTDTPRSLFISKQVDVLYLHWLPPATDHQHGNIIDYNVSCVVVEEGRDPYDATLHDTSDAWAILVSQLGYRPDNINKPINVAMPMFTPFQLLSCRVAGINKNGQGPYKYHVTTVNPPGVNIKVEDLQAVVTNNRTIVFQWRSLTKTNITKLAVIGYLLQCDGGSHDDHTWQHTVWDPRLSMATVPSYQLLTAVQYNCTITAFNQMGFGLHSDIAQLQIHGSSNSEKWYNNGLVIYILLSLIGVTTVIIILLLSCLCYCACHHRNKPYSGNNEIASNPPNKTVDNNYLQSIQYESLDNLYDKTPPPNNKIQPPSNKLNTSLDGDDGQLPAEEDYMQMAPSRSCSHATIKSETLRSGDVRLNQMDFGCQDNQQTTNLHYNSLPNHYNHYDIPPNNSLHSNSVTNNYYDTPRRSKLASTK